jgi:hypothetical protein
VQDLYKSCFGPSPSPPTEQGQNRYCSMHDAKRERVRVLDRLGKQ